ncbi:MAG: DUF5004 domain-containing protein [Bacteroidota bacterium]
MKHLYRRLMCLMIPALLLTACKEEESYEFGEPYDKIEGINGAFKLIQTIQYDELSRAFDNSLDVSDVFLGSNSMQINFNGSDFTYTVDANDSPNFLGEGGSWKFFNPEEPDNSNIYPTQVILTPNGGSEIILALSAPPILANPTVGLKLEKGCGGRNTVSYDLIFERLNP